MKALTAATLVMLLTLPLAACDSDDGRAERLGERVDDAVSDTRERLEDAADEAREAADEIGDALRDN